MMIVLKKDNSILCLRMKKEGHLIHFVEFSIEVKWLLPELICKS